MFAFADRLRDATNATMENVAGDFQFWRWPGPPGAQTLNFSRALGSVLAPKSKLAPPP